MVKHEKLVQLRKEKGLTQVELAEAVNVSRQAVSKWESGGALPSTENLIFLSKLYGVPIDYLVNDESEKPVLTETKEVEVSESGKKNRKWIAILVCVLTAVIVIVGVVAVITHSKAEILDFAMVGKEDWSDLETNDIPIIW